MHRLHVWAVCVLVGSTILTPAAADELYGIGSTSVGGAGAFLYRIDAVTGNASLVGPLETPIHTPVFLDSIEQHPDGGLLGLTFPTLSGMRTLYSINPATAQAELIASFPSSEWVRGLALHGDTLITANGPDSATTSQLASFEVDTAPALTNQGSTAQVLLNEQFEDLAISPTGRLIGAYRSSTSTLVPMQLGTDPLDLDGDIFNVGAELIRGIDFNSSGVLYGATLPAGPSLDASRLYMIDMPNKRLSATVFITMNGQNLLIRGIAFFPTLDGDFNKDEVVDGADFLAWQRGESDDPLSKADFDAWKQGFGAHAMERASASEVPEPHGGALLLMAMLVRPAPRRARQFRNRVRERT